MIGLLAISDGAWAALNGITVAIVGASALVVTTVLSRAARSDAREANRNASQAVERAARVEGASQADREQIGHLLEAINAANNERDGLSADRTAAIAGRAAAEESLRLCETGRAADRAAADDRFRETRHALANLAMELQAIAQAVRANGVGADTESAIHKRAESWRQSKEKPPP